MDTILMLGFRQGSSYPRHELVQVEAEYAAPDVGRMRGEGEERWQDQVVEAAPLRLQKLLQHLPTHSLPRDHQVDLHVLVHRPEELQLLDLCIASAVLALGSQAGVLDLGEVAEVVWVLEDLRHDDLHVFMVCVRQRRVPEPA